MIKDILAGFLAIIIAAFAASLINDLAIKAALFAYLSLGIFCIYAYADDIL